MTSTAVETAQMLQFLDPEGRLTVPEGYEEDFASLTPDLLKQLYQDMVVTRRFDSEGTSLQRQGHLALWVPLLGQEGAQIGIGRAMEPQDYAFPTYREHGVAYTRGMDVAELFTTFRGAAHSGLDTTKHNFHHYTMVLAAQMPHAVGYAMATAWDAQRAGKTEPGEATVAFFGDGSSSEGDSHEAMVFAASYKAPVVFFNQNNQWAISVPLSVQAQVPLAERARGYGFPGLRVDGNDVIATYIVSRRALADARAGKGPSLIEAYTYRLSAHTTADDPTKYRTREDEDAWRAKDPLVRMEKYLTEAGILTDADREEARAAGDAVAQHIREVVLAGGKPTLEDSFRMVYGEDHPLIEEELAHHLAYEASFDDAEGEA
jgi:pyruvate dehydrogenase E1 component alpha subunit